MLSPATEEISSLGTRRRKIKWGSIFFSLLITVFALIVAPLYIYKKGVTAWDVSFLMIYGFLTTLAISVGYHRLFSHQSLKGNVFVRFLALFMGAAAFEQSALKWASLHRRHHQYVDTEYDPYNIKYGFFYAHIGWILFWKQPINYENVKDLQKSRLLMHQHRHYQWWAISAGLLVPLAIGIAAGRGEATALFNLPLRLFLVHHCTFFINSVAHTFGSKTYDIHSSARDHWFGSLLTNGEGYHNFHHKFPTDYRNGIRWFDWDPGKWLIWSLEKARLVRDVKRTPPERILEARRAASIARSAQLS